MRNIYIQPRASPASRANYAKSVDPPVALGPLVNLLGTEQAQTVQRDFPEGVVSVWGVRTPKSQVWKSMKRDDIVLFYDTGEVISGGCVTTTLDSSPLALALWGDAEFRFTYLLRDVVELALPWGDVRDAAGYHQNFQRDFIRCSDQARDSILQKLPLNDLLLPGGTDQSGKQANLPEGRITGPLWRLSLIAQRAEQAKLKKAVFGSAKELQCALCGIKFPRAFIHAAHIKRRTDCSDDEKHEKPNIMAACTFGCDELYERGYLGVNPQGRVEVTDSLPITEGLSAYIERIRDKQCSAFGTSSSQFFAFHFSNSFRK